MTRSDPSKRENIEVDCPMLINEYNHSHSSPQKKCARIKLTTGLNILKKEKDAICQLAKVLHTLNIQMVLHTFVL